MNGLIVLENDSRPHYFYAVALATNNRLHGLAMRRAIFPARTWRALSVAIPVFAYIWRYSLEMNTKARRARKVGVQLDRFQMLGRL